jgi:hypothetical protein
VHVLIEFDISVFKIENCVVFGHLHGFLMVKYYMLTI